MFQHFLLMRVLETYKRRKVISATTWKPSKSDTFFSDLASPSHYLVFLWTGLYSFSQRVYQRWHAVYLCWQNGEIVALREASRGTAMPRLAASKPRREKTFSFPFLHSLSLNCTCLMSWHLFFQSFSPPPHSITSPPCPLLLFLVSLFLLHPMFFLLAFTMLQKGLRKSTILCYQETVSTTVLHILGANIHCPIFHAKGMRDMQEKKKKQHCSGTNNGANKITLRKLGFRDRCTCKKC